MEALKNIISKNEYLNDQLNNLENWKTDYFRMNELGGVDAIIYLEYKDFGYISKHSNFVEALEEVIEGHDISVYFDKSTPSISISSSEEAFVNFIGDELIVNDKCYKVRDDFEVFLYHEREILENGVYYGLYKAGYYGDCDPYSYDEDYLKYFSPDDKKRLEEIERIIDIVELRNELDVRTLMHWDLPQEIFDCLSVHITNLDDGIEILSVDEICATSFEVTFEFFEDDWEGVDTKAIIESLKHKQGNEYVYTHQFKTNSVRFMREILGGNDEMSFMSIG